MSFPIFNNEFGDWEKTGSFKLIHKEIIDHELQETGNGILFNGLFYSMKPQEIMFKPEGQRTWRWFTLITSQVLKIDDIVQFNCLDYRVFRKQDFYDHAGKYIYDIAEGFREL